MAMTRRLVVVVILAVGAAFAGVLPAPPTPEQPVFDDEAALRPESTASSSVWYCTWANSGGFRDSAYLVSSAVGTDIRVTLPSALSTEVPEQIDESIAAEPGAVSLELGEFNVRNGDAPGLVEIGRGPAAAAVAMRGEALLTADRCVRNLEKQWYLPGGTTREGRATTLRIFNPLPNDAKVEIVGASEFGLEPIAGLANLDVGSRSWVDVDLNQLVPFLDDLSLTLTVLEGDVVASLVVATPSGDEASWPGIAASPTWYFPTVTQGGLTPTLMLFNPGDLDVQATIDIFGTGVTTIDVATVDVPAGVPVRVDLTDFATGLFGVRVTSTGSVAAVVVAEDGDPEVESEDQPVRRFERIAGTVGSEVTARRWLLTGPNHLAEPRSSLWIMNPTADTVTVTIQPLGGRSLAADKISVDPGRARRYVIDTGTPGVAYLVEATQPVVTSWSIHTPQAVAFGAGTPIEDVDG
jgi:hypothetical protein